MQAEKKAAEFAKNPEVLALARDAAKQAVRQNLAIPLQVAGYGDVKVDGPLRRGEIQLAHAPAVA